MASSNSNGIPVSLTVTNSMGGPTVLSSAQASQLLQRLRAMNVPGGTQTIKIQAIQTNPITGVKQIVAIPIQAASGANRVPGSSPVKIIKLPGPVVGDGTKVISASPSGGLPAGVKVVKLAPSPMATSSGHQSNIFHVRTSQVISSPSKPVVVSSNHMTVSSNHMTVVNSSASNVVAENRGVKRGADINFDFEAFSDAKRRKTNEKGGKGLRHFSMKVCEKVQAKGLTSYNEVADELVAELTDPRCTSPTDQQYDQKNIRRRVYDALNVLMAMNIISKEKKEIRWLGLPTNSVQEANGLELEKTRRMERIRAKTQQLQDLILQQIAFKNLVERNKEREKRDGGPAPNSAIQLPFIIVNTSKKTVIDCSISNDKMEYLFNFDDTFEIHDDMEVLKRMGLSLGLERGQVSTEDLNKARSMLPRALEQYLNDLAKNGIGACTEMPRVTSPKMMKVEPLDFDANYDSDDTDVDVN